MSHTYIYYHDNRLHVNSAFSLTKNRVKNVHVFPVCTNITECQAIPILNFKDLKVFLMSIVMVIGPTPPGTGVM